MPLKPPVFEARTPESRRAAAAQYDRRRGSAASRGYDRRWDRSAKAFLRRQPLCAAHRELGRLVPATLVDHIVPHQGDQTLFWDTSNWQPLCAPCHAEKTYRDEAAFGQDREYPRALRAPKCDVVLVCGPPGAGKSTYVAKRAKPADLVIDFDQILAEISRRPIYEGYPEYGKRALAERNRRLLALADEPARRRAWVIVGAPGHARTWWTGRLKPSRTVVLAPLLPTLLERIEADPRRQPVREEHRRAAERWWVAEMRSGAMRCGSATPMRCDVV
jgi:5-methylcytosine-specific restriction protein A